jgi:hypothetical protein
MIRQGQGKWVRAGAIGLLALALGVVAGCSQGKASVSGKVKLKDGTPVSAGNVAFWTDDKHLVESALSPDGSYTVPDAPVGPVKITVRPPPQMLGGRPPVMTKPPPGLGGMPADKAGADAAPPPTPPKVVPIPDRYTKYETTPETYTVTKGGAQTHDITLE